MTDRKFESEKERNLNYKFFAGFYFNGLIDWHSECLDRYFERMKDLYRLLKRPAFRLVDDQMVGLQPSGKHILVSFDNHIDRFDGKFSGEFADILIHDQPNGLLIGIEAKYLDDWDYEKDIVENGKKLQSMARKLRVEKSLLCLLVTETKWTNVITRQGSKNSNFDRLRKHTKHVAVIHWEMLNALDSVHSHVRNYMIDQLHKD